MHMYVTHRNEPLAIKQAAAQLYIWKQHYDTWCLMSVSIENSGVKSTEKQGQNTPQNRTYNNKIIWGKKTKMATSHKVLEHSQGLYVLILECRLHSRKSLVCFLIALPRRDMYRLSSIGPSTEPRGTPKLIPVQTEDLSLVNGPALV